MKILSMIAAAVAMTSYLMAAVVLFTEKPIMGGSISGWVRLAMSSLLFAIFFILFDRAYLKDDDS